jgi:hypothetical protein
MPYIPLDPALPGITGLLNYKQDNRYATLNAN